MTKIEDEYTETIIKDMYCENVINDGNTFEILKKIYDLGRLDGCHEHDIDDEIKYD